jgi:hypothetical protein
MKHIFPINFTFTPRVFLLVAVLGLFFRASTVQAQIFDEPGGGVPAGWTLSDDPDGGEDVDQGNHFRLEAGLDVSQEYILTDTYNLTGYTNVVFKASVSRFGTGTSNPLTVEVSTDGGITFPQVYTGATPTSNAYVTQTFNIATVGAGTVLRFTNRGASGRGVRLQNLLLTGDSPVPPSITTGTIAGSPFCIAGSGVAVSVPFTIGGAFTPGNTFTAQLSNASGVFSSPTTIGTLSGTSAGTISATLPTTLVSGASYRIRVVADMPATTGSVNTTNLSITNAAFAVVTSLTATPSNSQVLVQWANPTSCFDDVVVVARANTAVTATPSATSYSASAVFGSGANLGSNQYVVYQGAGTSVAVTGLTNGTTYHFSVFTRKGTIYGPASPTSATPTGGPSLTEVFVPSYIAGRPATGTVHANRLPYAFRVTINGLTPNATYLFYNRGVAASDNATFNGAGNVIFARSSGSFVRSTAPALTTAANRGQFQADAAGSYTGWFILEPTADARFYSGEQVYQRIYLNNGAGGTSVVTRLTTTSAATALHISSNPTDGTGIIDSSLAAPRNFVLLYDNTAGSGRPVAATYVESDGVANTSANGFAGFYANRVEAKSGKWGTLIPNANANGVRRIEQRALSDGSVVGCVATDADGTWPSLAATASPTGGSTPVVLSAIDAPLSCGVYVGLNPPNQSAPEGNSGATTVPVRVTVTSAPATALSVLVSNAGGGTATSGTDYFFNGQTLIFPTTGTYPMTQTVTAQFYGDPAVESNETINLAVSVTSGSATVLNSPGTLVIADDDFLATGLIINEFSQGPSGAKEYVELLVTGTPGATADLRGWVVDDNNGSFSGGAMAGVGISAGHFRFDQSCTWEKVRVGSVIVLYNQADPNVLMPADDPTDGDLDFLYVVPVLNSGTCGVISGNSGDYLDGDCTGPSTSSATYPTAGAGPRWSQVEVGTNDAIQLRQPGTNPAFFHGISFRASGTSSLTDTNHPDYATLGSNVLYYDGTPYQTYYFDNTTGNNFRNKNNWVAQVGSGQETPGNPNSTRNALFIESLRQPLVPATNSSSYSCFVRPQETRVFLDASNRLLLKLVNQSTTDYGTVAAQTVVGSNSQNANLEGTPFFLGKQYQVTPTTTSPADYTITFYVTDAELDSYASYVSAQTGQPRTASFLKPRLNIYKNSGTVLPSVAPDGNDMVVATPTIGTYSAGVSTYTATFTSFSTFAIGATIDEVLPVELVRLAAAPSGNAIRVSWTTASERDADHFEVQRSADGREFQTIGSVRANGSTLSTHDYNFFDKKPLAGLAYYRLRQVDTNGPSHLSEIVTARMGAPVKATMEAWPVPMDATLTVRLMSPSAGAAVVRMLDLQGRLVQQQTEQLNAGVTDVLLPTQALAGGTYLVEVLLPSGEALRTKVTK